LIKTKNEPEVGSQRTEARIVWLRTIEGEKNYLSLN